MSKNETILWSIVAIGAPIVISIGVYNDSKVQIEKSRTERARIERETNNIYLLGDPDQFLKPK